MKSVLNVKGIERTLISFRLPHRRRIDTSGYPCSLPRDSFFYVSFLAEEGDDFFMQWMCGKNIAHGGAKGFWHDGEIVFYDETSDGQEFYRYDLQYVMPIHFRLEYDHQNGMVIHLTLTALDRVYNRLFHTENFYGYFFEYAKPKERPKPMPKEEPVVYVRDFDADKEEAQPNEKVTYKVTKYSQEKVTENDKKRIQWAIKIDGKQEVLKEKGEKLELTIKEEWAGKEIIVMPFLVKPTEKVSEKTKIIKWFLPRVLIQTKTYEGFGLKSERNIYEYQDANGNGLTRRKPTDPIAEDMHYGSGGVHTGNFEWFDIKDEAVLKNITELNQYPTENLFEVFKNLIQWTSKGALETNNLNMVNNMRFGGGRYQNPILTEAVFNHETTKRFVEKIIENFKEKIRQNDIKGNLNKIKLELKDLIRPSFSSLNDRMEGLTIALNDTWGFRVIITKYSYNPQTKDVEATLKFRIIDHFGLDVADIESYGTKQKIYAKFGDMLVRKMNISLDIEKSKNVFEFLRLGYKYTSVKGFILGSLESSGYNPVEQMALGFCAWFILQHLRGYKPFVTIMEKEETLKFKI